MSIANIYNFYATLKSLDSIEVAVNKPYNSPLAKDMRLYKDGKLVKALKCISKSESKSTFIYIFTLDVPIIPGSLYELADGKNEFSPLDITFLATLPDFEETYRYDGELGAIYSKEKTTFRVFSPLASEMVVKTIKGAEINYTRLQRLPSGVYEGEIEGDLSGVGYIYQATINGVVVNAVDPYAKSVGLNSRLGYIVDLERLKKIDLQEDKLPTLDDPCKAVIYELDVRDMTSLTDLKDKGTYNALAKEGLKDKDGNPQGIDYIASLGVSHIQLMPVFDFQTISDDEPFSTYNWGYDPIFWFAPEGSYSSDPSDPYKRMEELRGLVAAFHKKGIRVNMDVVFNHTFQFLTSSLNKLCPNYYYRFTDDGFLSEGSGCGNDIESRRFMMRKLIIDCLTYFVQYYGIDGFRFDLMGLIDKTTLTQAFFKLKALKPEMICYGEGWDMMTALPSSEKGSMNNAASLKDYGFFNDRFRDILRGRIYGKDLSPKGYLTGDTDYIDGFKHVFLSSVVSLAFPPLFTSPKQSINYVECHDDGVLFDKVEGCWPDEDEENILKRVNLINSALILAFGIPFVHAGQEIGQSKQGVTNSYDAGDKINGFDWEKAGERKNMSRYFADLVALKKKYPSFSLNSKKELMDRITFENLSSGALAIKYASFDDEPEIIVIINPSEVTVRYQFDKYFRIVFNEAGLLHQECYSQLVLVNGLSLIVAVGS